MALCVFMLRTKHLVVIYMNLISVGVVFISYWSNVDTVKAIISNATENGTTTSILDDVLCLNLPKVLDPEGPAFLVVQNYILQCTLALVFYYLHLAPRYFIVQKALILSFMAPSIIAILPLPVSLVRSIRLRIFGISSS